MGCIKHKIKILSRARKMNEAKAIAMVVGFALLCCSAPAWADTFLGLDTPPGGRVVSKTDHQLEMAYDQDPATVRDFYEKFLKEEVDVKFKDRGGKIVVEDHDSRPWHSITIDKDEKGHTGLTIRKDSWGWIVGTLILRFFGVFAVLLVLYLAMSITGAIVSRAVKLGEAKK